MYRVSRHTNNTVMYRVTWHTNSTVKQQFLIPTNSLISWLLVTNSRQDTSYWVWQRVKVKLFFFLYLYSWYFWPHCIRKHNNFWSSVEIVWLLSQKILQISHNYKHERIQEITAKIHSHQSSERSWHLHLKGPAVKNKWLFVTNDKGTKVLQIVSNCLPISMKYHPKRI